jgi:replication factor A1
VDFIDQTGEIKATCFNDTCDKFYDLFQIDQVSLGWGRRWLVGCCLIALVHLSLFTCKVYMISKAQLKTANKQYTTINNDYEMSFTNETTVEQCSDEQDDVIPRICVNLIPLSELLNKNANDLVGKT